MARPTKYSDDMPKKAIEYAYKDDLPSVEAFAIKLKVVKSTLYEWAKRNKEFSNALKIIKQNYQQKLINGGLRGEFNPVFAKFLLSAQHGLTESSNIDHTTKGDKLNSIDYSKLSKSALEEIARA